MNTTASGMAVELLEQIRNEQQARIGPSVETLLSIANHYQQSRMVESLEKVRNGLSTEIFRIIVVGRMKNGKSTFLNALLGRLTNPGIGTANLGAPLPMHEDPCTAVLTEIYYSETPTVRVLRRNPMRWEEWSIERYLKESRIRPDREEHQHHFQDIVKFELGFPCELCRAGVRLIDSPGTDDEIARDEITLDALQDSDAAIAFFRSSPLAGMSEIDYAKGILSGGMSDYFTVVNLWGNRKPDDDLRKHVWTKLVLDLKGGSDLPKYDFVGENIYFVNAKQALEGKLAGDNHAVVESGMQLFEFALVNFLQTARLPAKTNRFVGLALSNTSPLTNHLHDRLRLVAVDREKFEQRYKEIEPLLAQVHARRAKLPRIVDHWRKHCYRRVENRYDDLVSDIQRELPSVINAAELPSLQGWKGVVFGGFQKKKVTQEAVDCGSNYVNKRINDWLKAPLDQPGFRRTVAEVQRELLVELADEIGKIENDYTAITARVTGDELAMQKGAQAGPGMHWLQRVGAGSVGLLLGQPDYIFSGARDGFKGLGRDAVGRLALAGAVWVLGAPLGIAVAAGAVGGLLLNIFWGSKSLDQEVKSKAIEMLLNGQRRNDTQNKSAKGSQDQESEKIFEGVRSELDKHKPQLEERVNDLFAALEEEILKEVNSACEQEEQALKDTLRVNAQGAEAKLRLIKQMQTDLETVQTCERTLSDLLVAVQQA